MYRFRNNLFLIILIFFIQLNVAIAVECSSSLKAVTHKDDNISVEVLTYKLKPLTKCELEIEANAWLNLLKHKVSAISNTRVAAIYKVKEITAAEDVEEALEEVNEAKKDKDKEEKIESAKDAKEALKEKKAAEKKLSQDKSLQKAVEAAKNTARKKGEVVSKTDKSIEAKSDLKITLLEHVNLLIAERTILIDQLNAVLTELKAKGGETKEYDDYIKAVSGIKVDVTDASAAWTTITGWIMSAEGGLRLALNFLKFVVIIMVFYLFSLVAGKAAKKAFSKSKHVSTLLCEFLVMSARRVILLIGLFVGLSALEINVGPVLAVIGAAGFVIAFALQDSLSNFASGILMLVYRPFDIGDVIKVAGTQGQVESMNLLSTQLKTPDNQLVIVPNNSAWGDVIVNITGIKQRRVDLVFGIGYNDDIDKAQKIMQSIVDEHELILKEPKAVIHLHELADSSVNFICRPWVKTGDYWDVYWYITREVKCRFDAAGISIPYPQQDVHIHKS